jgi:tetratricopeptide (TPR) repeat protein
MRMKSVLAVGICLSLIHCATAQQKLARSREKDPRYQYNLGLVHLNRNDPESAVAYLNKCLALDPRYFPAWNALGLARSLQGKLPESVEAFKKCLEINPRYTESHNNLGTIYQEMGFLDKAEEEFKKALEDAAYPSRELPCYNLARLCYTTNRTDEAYGYIRECIKLKSRFGMAHNLMGLILERKGDMDGAVDAYEQAVRTVPADTNFNFNLAVACFKTGAFDKAKDIFDKIFPLVTDEAIKARIRDYQDQIRKK